jgi:hypothetical protein
VPVKRFLVWFHMRSWSPREPLRLPVEARFRSYNSATQLLTVEVQEADLPQLRTTFARQIAEGEAIIHRVGEPEMPDAGLFAPDVPAPLEAARSSPVELEDDQGSAHDGLGDHPK